MSNPKLPSSAPRSPLATPLRNDVDRLSPRSITIDPVSRIEGHLKIDVNVEATAGGTWQVFRAEAVGALFRGFEVILQGRHPWDAVGITQRICGVCPVSHAQAAVEALDAASGVTPPDNARVQRNLALGANFLQSHILHFYHLAVLDYIAGPNMKPWEPDWPVDRRFDAATTATLVQHYIAALEMRRKAHTLGAIFGGKMPHPSAFVPGGFTNEPTAAQLTEAHAVLDALIDFIDNIYIPDVQLLGTVYSDYYQIGSGPDELLAYGVFDLDATGTNKLLGRGRAVVGTPGILPVDVNAIAEDVTRSWYADSTSGLSPAQGETVPQYPKRAGYSWLKAPRYSGTPQEVGPLARMWVNGDYQNGVSVIDRHMARALETSKIAHAMDAWINQVTVGATAFTQHTMPNNATAYGLTEAPRGALGHWLKITNGVIERYQVVTPTCWNASPRCSNQLPGPIEQALHGTEVAVRQYPIELMRVVHSFDPCLACAVHVMQPEGEVEVVKPTRDAGSSSPRVG